MEYAFGIMSVKCRVLRRPIILEPFNAELVVQACTICVIAFSFIPLKAKGLSLIMKAKMAWFTQSCGQEMETIATE